MNEKERKVECCRLDVEDAKSQLRAAELKLESTMREHRAVMDKAMAQCKADVEVARNKVTREAAYLAEATKTLAEGFTS